MIEPLRTWLASCAPETRIDPRGGCILLGGDRHPDAKVTLLLFDPSGVPAVIVKMPRRGGIGAAALEAEYDALRRLQGALGEKFLSLGLPRPMALGVVAGRVVLAESVVAGAPLTTRYYRQGHVSDPGSVHADLQMVSEWVRAFRSASRAGTVPLSADTLERWVGSVLSRFAATFGASPALQDLFGEIDGRARELEGCPIPMGGSHGDLAIANVLIDEDRVSGVVDWELGAVEAPPFADIYKFPLSYSAFLDRAAPGGKGEVLGHPGRRTMGQRWSRFGDWPNLVGFAYAFFGEGWFPDRIRSFISEELSELGLPAALNGLFFPAFLAQQAMTLPDPAYREGYRQVLEGFAAGRTHSWLWRAEAGVAS